MWEFIKTHSFSIFCTLIVIWIIGVIRTQHKYKTKGVQLIGEIVGYKRSQGNIFPVFQFEYEGEQLTVDSYHADKVQEEAGSTDTIYYLPGNTKGVFRERDIKPKLWMIVIIVVAIAYIIMDLTVFHK